jgi:hypothetical protein
MFWKTDVMGEKGRMAKAEKQSQAKEAGVEQKVTWMWEMAR